MKSKSVHTPWSCTASGYRVRLLEQWVDGTSVESEQASKRGYQYDVTASGFAWHLYESCLKLLKNIIQESGQLEGQNISLETQLLIECLSRLFLWGEGFGISCGA
jgi:hypothetical protein